MEYTDRFLWDATEQALEGGKLPVSAIAESTGRTEQCVMAALMREAGRRRRVVEINFPAHPKAFVLSMSSGPSVTGKK